jgi:hypothetical protein
LVNGVGQLIGTIRVNTGLNEINDFDNLANGVYFLVNTKIDETTPLNSRIVINKNF